MNDSKHKNENNGSSLDVNCQISNQKVCNEKRRIERTTETNYLETQNLKSKFESSYDFMALPIDLGRGVKYCISTNQITYSQTGVKGEVHPRKGNICACGPT